MGEFQQTSRALFQKNPGRKKNNYLPHLRANFLETFLRRRRRKCQRFEPAICPENERETGQHGPELPFNAMGRPAGKTHGREPRLEDCNELSGAY